MKSYDDDTKTWVYYSQKTLLIVLKTYFHDAWTSKNEHLSEKYFFSKTNACSFHPVKMNMYIFFNRKSETCLSGSHTFPHIERVSGLCKMIKTSTLTKKFTQIYRADPNTSKKSLANWWDLPKGIRFGLANCTFLARDWYPFHQCWDTLFFWKQKIQKMPALYQSDLNGPR